MITQHNVLLREMLFLDSMLTIVTNLAWEPVSQDLSPRITQQQYMSLPETEPGTPSPWLILYQSYLWMYALGKGLMELLQP